MSRRKQTNPRAIKRDVSQDDDDENPTSIVKKFAPESTRSDSIDSTATTEDEQQSSAIRCDTCQEIFLTSEQFNHHRLYQCSFLTEEPNSDESRTSSYDEYGHQIDTIPYGTNPCEEYPHPCAYCHKAFSNMALLLKHEQVHVELMPFRCSFCGKGFKHRRSLNRHSKLHTGERKFKCTLCESTFARSDHLKAHIRTHSNNNANQNSTTTTTTNNNNNNSITIDKSINLDFQLKIPLNTKTDLDERTISSNIKINRDEKRTEHCPYCPRVCLGEDSLRSHIQSEHHRNPDDDDDSLIDHAKSERLSPSSTDTYCHLCNAKFNTRENYYAHLRCTHPPFQKSLDQISLFQIPSVKQSHDRNDDSVLNEYALIEKTIWCEKCKRSFDSTTVYLQHYSFQHCLQIIKCLQCQDVFETIDLFFNHIERIHPSKTVETFKCKLCNATYKHRSDFLHHVQTVHKSNLFSCSLCSCQLNSAVELSDHLKFIHKINQNMDFHLNHRRPSFNTLFPCAFCSLKFNSRFDLNQHILHEHNHDERRNVIPEWPSNGRKSCTPSSSDVVCTVCDLTFPSESLLIEHNKHTHRSPPLSSILSPSPSFRCTYCHALFTSRTQLDRHSRIHIASSGNNLKCNICDRLFSSIDVLSEHKLSHCKATTSNICLHCHQVLNNEADFARHLHEHNHQHHHLKSKSRLFTTTNDNTLLAITCIVCKQSLINEREIDLHAKFHLANISNKRLAKEISLISIPITCDQCHQSTNTQLDFLLELPSFKINCFNCIVKDFKSADPCTIPEIDFISTSFSCPKCRHDVQFDSIKTYQQHFTSVHLSSHSTEEYHCLKCNKIVSSREHILEHRNKKFSSSSSSGFLIDSIDTSVSSRCSSPPRVHYCYLCRTNFDTAIKMHIHLIEHQYPNHDYQCSLCDLCSFDDASQLYHHMVQHGSKARLHPCRECDVYFMFSMHLINHQYSHTAETMLSKTNGNSVGTKFSMKSRSIANEQNRQTNEDDDGSCKAIVTRSSTKGTCRSVIVS